MQNRERSDRVALNRLSSDDHKLGKLPYSRVLLMQCPGYVISEIESLQRDPVAALPVPHLSTHADHIRGNWNLCYIASHFKLSSELQPLGLRVGSKGKLKLEL